MDELKSRLADCFRIVFPDLPDDSIATASQQTVANWDSVAAITLMNVIEEEFGFQIDLEAVADLDTFEVVYAFVQREVEVS